MRFNSLTYWFFLAAVVAVLWLLSGRRQRRAWLLAASYLFYASWHWPYLFLLLGSVVFNHLGARWIVGAEDRRRRGAAILAGNLALLAVFKYLDWLIVNLGVVTGWVGLAAPFEPLGLVLPLGISFYLFQAMSYIVDLMRKREKLHGFWDFQLYITYFPQLIAGPIMRAKEFLPQLTAEWKIRPEDVRLGVRWIVTGLFVKIVLADGLAPAVDRAFARSPDVLGSTDVVIMAVAFGLQIYFDFSAYTRIAIGSARLCGLRLVENFNFPYSANSPADFWARWHISLSRWIRDYLFYPLASGRPGLGGLCWAALVAMTLCGVWHGAGWTFVLWGFYHGVLIAGYHLLTFHRRRPGARRREAGPASPLARLRTATGATFSILTTFALVSFGWIWFRSVGVEQAWTLSAHLLTPWSHAHRTLSGTFYLHTTVLMLLVWAVPFFQRAMERVVAPRLESLDAGSQPNALNWVYSVGEGVILGVLLAFCLVYLRGQTAFIYFQF